MSGMGGKTLLPDTDCYYQELHGPRSGDSATELSLEAQDLPHVLVHVVKNKKNKSRFG